MEEIKINASSTQEILTVDSYYINKKRKVIDFLISFLGLILSLFLLLRITNIANTIFLFIIILFIIFYKYKKTRKFIAIGAIFFILFSPLIIAFVAPVYPANEGW